MKIRYFPDTDTAHIEFSDGPIEETRELSADVYLDLGPNGILVSMTVEHAKETANISEVAFVQMDKAVA
jgi:uncharacterized protein YuzE